jgi:hypothetical protein
MVSSNRNNSRLLGAWKELVGRYDRLQNSWKNWTGMRKIGTRESYGDLGSKMSKQTIQGTLCPSAHDSNSRRAFVCPDLGHVLILCRGGRTLWLTVLTRAVPI